MLVSIDFGSMGPQEPSELRPAKSSAGVSMAAFTKGGKNAAPPQGADHKAKWEGLRGCREALPYFVSRTTHRPVIITNDCYSNHL